MMGFAVIVGAILAGANGSSFIWVDLLLGCTTGFALTAASMVANDYYDRDIDLINEPNRPIPSGLIKPREALFFAFLLAAVGFTTAYLTGIFSLAMAFVAWLVLMAYTAFGKRSGLPGNFLVSTCVAIPFIYGSIVVTSAVQLNVLLFVAMVFLSNTGREVTKGIVDVQGDRAREVNTLAVRFGEGTAATVASAFYVSATLLSPIPMLLKLVTFWFLPLVAVTDIGLLASSMVLLKDHSRERARTIKKIVLLCFAIGLMAFLAGAPR
jgi:geranylgeranylglycerol-phosphate geranylgeranyltransferase